MEPSHGAGILECAVFPVAFSHDLSVVRSARIALSPVTVCSSYTDVEAGLRLRVVA